MNNAESSRRAADFSLPRLIRSPGFIWVNGVAFGVLGVLGFYARTYSKGPAFARLFADPFVNSRFVYLGLLTNLSEVIWCIALAICLFSFGVVRSLRPPRSSDWFFLGTAWVIAVLLLDDLQRVTLALFYGAGVPKFVSYGAYGLMMALYFWVFRRHILRRTPYPLLLITVLCFALSTLTDLAAAMLNLKHLQGPTSLFEDGSKLVGLLNLVLFCWKVGVQEIKRAIPMLEVKDF